MKSIGTGIMAGAILLAWTGMGIAADDPALAALMKEGPQAILEEVDRRHNTHEDQTIRVRMTTPERTQRNGGAVELTTITLGAKKRAVRVHSPADLKGMGVVIIGNREITALMPGLTRPQRIGGSNKKQSFMGTDWNFDDMALIRLAADYEASIQGEEGGHLLMTLTRKPDSEFRYETIDVRLDRSRIMIDHLSFREGGKVVKVQERSDPKVMSAGHTLYNRVVMRTVANGHWTEMVVLDEKINTGVNPKLFRQKKKWLLKGR
jgi:hypothetical protein